MKLANLSSLHDITNQFSVDKSTARQAVQEVCLGIQNVLANCFTYLINPQKMIATLHHIGFPSCMGP